MPKIANMSTADAMIKVSLRGVGHSRKLSAGRRSNLAVKDEIATLPPLTWESLAMTFATILNALILVTTLAHFRPACHSH